MDYKTDSVGIIGLFVGIISIIIPVVSFMLTAPEDLQSTSIIIFGTIAVVLIFVLSVYFLYSNYKKMLWEIRENKKDISDIKKSLNYKNLFDSMNIRLNIVEKLLDRKKGQIDPRIIGIIILLILLYLFLKSMKILP